MNKPSSHFSKLAAIGAFALGTGLCSLSLRDSHEDVSKNAPAATTNFLPHSGRTGEIRSHTSLRIREIVDVLSQLGLASLNAQDAEWREIKKKARELAALWRIYFFSRDAQAIFEFELEMIHESGMSNFRKKWETIWRLSLEELEKTDHLIVDELIESECSSPDTNDLPRFPFCKELLKTVPNKGEDFFEKVYEESDDLGGRQRALERHPNLDYVQAALDVASRKPAEGDGFLPQPEAFVLCGTRGQELSRKDPRFVAQLAVLSVELDMRLAAIKVMNNRGFLQHYASKPDKECDDGPFLEKGDDVGANVARINAAVRAAAESRLYELSHPEEAAEALYYAEDPDEAYCFQRH